LRGSIGNIRNVFRFMLDGMVDPVEDRDIIFDAEITSRHTFNLLENLLYWAKSQQGTIKIHQEIIDVEDAVSDVLDQEMGSALNKTIELKKNVSPGLKLYADRITLNIILRNLIMNAIKFTPGKGKIEVLASENKDGIHLTVKDNGVGISPEDIAKIIEKAELFSNKGTNQESGTGLGLVIVSEFLEMNKGRLEIKSELGKGSEFIVTFPLTDHDLSLDDF